MKHFVVIIEWDPHSMSPVKKNIFGPMSKDDQLTVIKTFDLDHAQAFILDITNKLMPTLEEVEFDHKKEQHIIDHTIKPHKPKTCMLCSNKAGKAKWICDSCAAEMEE